MSNIDIRLLTVNDCCESGRMGVDATAHGFRSIFRDWAAECTSAPRETAELSLAHEVGNAVERAYRRSESAAT